MPASAPHDYASADLACDIVMKGGITSGVVYPRAVVELARRYRFKSIGGTSAGAIAAAIVAAAEHARDSGGFTAVERLPAELAGERDGRPFMLQLIQPDRATRPLFAALLGFLRGGPAGGVLAGLRAFWRFPALAVAVALVAIGLWALGGAHVAFAVAGVACAAVILAFGVPLDVALSARALARNDFGICRLGPGVGTEAAPALTGWLHQRLQAVSGRPGAEPLTFADLWGAPADETRRERVLALSRRPDERAVDLQMVTTDLTHGRPWRLPVPYQRHRDVLEDGGGLLFEPAELARFFPPDVVAHLERHAPPLGEETAAHLAREAPGRTLLHFPIGPELPVVVATRMSLSFPVLISAVPLWELDYRARPQAPPLRRVVFSDGGITSNFPVHFFDSPLPTRPTFGLHLTGFPRGRSPDPLDPSRSVWGPPPVSGRAYENATEFDGLRGFLMAIKDAMQNWRDNAQAKLPGFRERVIDIGIASGEGGLNLAMSGPKIEELTQRGAVAGRRLIECFAGAEGAGGPPRHWNDHRFARYRVLMSLIERMLRDFQRGYTFPADRVTVPYPERIEQGAEPPYPLQPRSRLELARRTTRSYLELAETWDGGQTLDDPNVPRPPSTLRAVPPV